MGLVCHQWKPRCGVLGLEGKGSCEETVLSLVEIGLEVLHNGGAEACLYESLSHMTTRSNLASRIV